MYQVQTLVPAGPGAGKTNKQKTHQAPADLQSSQKESSRGSSQADTILAVASTLFPTAQGQGALLTLHFMSMASPGTRALGGTISTVLSVDRTPPPREELPYSWSTWLCR